MANAVCPGVREEGDTVRHDEQWKHQHCWGAYMPHIPTKSPYAQHICDSTRAIDYLTSLTDLVDPAHIGMIGHSLGGGTTTLTAAFDPRVKAAMASCGDMGLDCWANCLGYSWLPPRRCSGITTCWN